MIRMCTSKIQKTLMETEQQLAQGGGGWWLMKHQDATPWRTTCPLRATGQTVVSDCGAEGRMHGRCTHCQPLIRNHGGGKQFN